MYVSDECMYVSKLNILETQQDSKVNSVVVSHETTEKAAVATGLGHENGDDWSQGLSHRHPGR